MKFSQLKEHNKSNIFLIYFLHAKSEAGRLAPELFLFVKKD